jgi:transmembrane sensor
MDNVHPIPDVGKAEAEASDWIARLNADDVSAEDRGQFDVWRAAQPLNARVYEELSATWNEFVAAGPMVRAASFAQSMNEATRVRTPWRRWTAAAAAVLVVVASGLYMQRLFPGTKYQTAVGEQATVSLPDGSTLQLNSNSLARVIYSDNARVIRLVRGEAFFKVAHNANRPFWVVGGNSWVRAVGTAFNVYIRATGIRVTVSEGTVKVGSADALANRAPPESVVDSGPVAVLTVGQQADLGGTATATRSLSSAELARSVAWMDGTLYFERQPLGDVVDELSRYTTVRLIVDDEKLRQLSVGGTFQASPQGAEALLTMLQQGLGLQVRREENRVYIESDLRRH